MKILSIIFFNIIFEQSDEKYFNKQSIINLTDIDFNNNNYTHYHILNLILNNLKYLLSD